MTTLPNEIINLILAQLPMRDLIFINKYYNNYKYFRLKQHNLKISPFSALRKFENLQINLITHSKYKYFKNIDTPDDEKYVFSVSDTKRNKKRHTIPPELYKNLRLVNIYMCNEMLDDSIFLYINYNTDDIEKVNTQKVKDHEPFFRWVICRRFYDWSGFV